MLNEDLCADAHQNDAAEYLGLTAQPAAEFFAQQMARKAADERDAGDEGSRRGDVHIQRGKADLTRYELKVNGQVVDAPPKELELLYYLASHPNRVFTRDQLLDEVWGFEYYGDSRTIDVHVKRLREKLENTSDQWSLKTVWGVGYKFEVKE